MERIRRGERGEQEHEHFDFLKKSNTEVEWKV